MMCVCVYTYVCMYVCTYIRCVCMYVYMYVRTYVCMHDVCVRVCVRMHVCMYVCMYVTQSVTRHGLYSADRTPVPTRFSGPSQTGLEAHPTVYILGTRPLSRGYSGQGMAFTMHPLVAPLLSKGTVTAVLSPCACSACHGTAYIFMYEYVTQIITAFTSTLSGTLIFSTPTTYTRKHLQIHRVKMALPY